MLRSFGASYLSLPFASAQRPRKGCSMEAGLNLGIFRLFVGVEATDSGVAPFGATVSVSYEDNQTRVQLNIYLISGFLSFGIGIVNSEKGE